MKNHMAQDRIQLPVDVTMLRNIHISSDARIFLTWWASVSFWRGTFFFYYYYFL